MELQLCLALPTNPSHGFDLNGCNCEPNKGLGSDQPTQMSEKKRSLSYEENSDAFPPTLPLLVWQHDPNERDDPYEEDDSCLTVTKNGEEGNELVGWPPLQTWRKRVSSHNNGGWGDRTVENGGGFAHGRRQSNCLYVKVKMEGVAIARKVDLSLHHSFATLVETLIGMFAIWESGEENESKYKLAFQDNEGDWLFAENVPWRTFIHTVQRLKLMKTSHC